MSGRKNAGARPVRAALLVCLGLVLCAVLALAVRHVLVSSPDEDKAAGTPERAAGAPEEKPAGIPEKSADAPEETPTDVPEKAAVAPVEKPADVPEKPTVAPEETVAAAPEEKPVVVPEKPAEITRAELLIRSARTAARRRDWEPALNRFEEALPLCPDDADLQKEYAGILYQSGNAAKALDEYDRILETRPDRADVQDAAVEVCMAVQDFESVLERLLEYRPGREKERDFRLRLARAFTWTDQPDRAAPVYAGLVREDPSSRTVYNEYLNALLAAHFWGEFDEQSKLYLERFPDDERVQLFRVDALLLHDKVPEALSLLEGLIKDPKAAPEEAWLRAADLYLAVGRSPAEVGKMLERAAAGRSAPKLRARLALLSAYDGAFHAAFSHLSAAAQMGASEDLLASTRAELFALGQMQRTALDCFESADRPTEASVRALKGIAASALALDRQERAKSALRRALIRYPGDMDATYRYVRLLAEYGDTATALDVINMTLAGRPENPTARLLRGRLRVAVGRPEEAEEDFDFVASLLAEEGAKAVLERGRVTQRYMDLVPADVWLDVCERSPDDVVARGRLAAALFRERRLHESARVWDSLMTEHPDEPMYRLGLVEALAVVGATLEPEERERLSSEMEVLSGSPGLSRSDLGRLAELLAKLTKWEALVRVSKRMLEEQPDDGHATALHAGALMALDRTTEAEASIEWYLHLEPDNVLSGFALWTRLGDLGAGPKDEAFRLAMNHLQEMCAEHPDNFDLLYAAGRLAATHRQFDQARALFDALLAVLPDDPATLLWRARVEGWDGNHEESVQFYVLYENANPYDGRVHLEKARALGWAGRFDESLDAYTRGIELLTVDERIQAAAGNLAEVLRLEREAKRAGRARRERRAISYYDQLLGLRPDDSEVLFERGQIETRLGFSRRAAGYYERILLLTPGHNEARDALAHEESRLGPSLIQSYDFRKEDGFDDRFEITEHLITTRLWSPELDGMWRFGVESQKAFYRFREFPDPTGWRGRIMAQKRFDSGLQLDAWLRESWFNNPDHTTINLAIEARHKAFDRIETLLGFDREDVIENYPTLAADLQRDRIRLGLAGDPTPRVRLETEGAYVHYEDDNDGVQGLGSVSYELLRYPRLLKISYGAEYRDFEHQERIYFSPEEFVQHGPTVHWRHYLQRQHYSGANQLYYGFKMPLRLDSRGDLYIGGAVEFLWDITHRLQVGAEASTIFSHPYDAYFGRTWLRYSF